MNEGTINGKHVSECNPKQVDYYRRLLSARKQRVLKLMGQRPGGLANVLLVVKGVQIGAQS